MSINWFNTTSENEVSYTGNFKVIGDIEVTGLVRRNGEVFESITPQWSVPGPNTIVYNPGGTPLVGIGTSSPNSTLDVRGSISYTGDLKRNGVVLNFGLGAWNGDGGVAGGTIYYGDKVGVGEGFFSGKPGGNNAKGSLHIWNTSTTSARWNPESGLRVGPDEITSPFIQMGVTKFGLETWGWLQSARSTNSTPNRLLINPDGGNVGIGCSSQNTEALVSISTRQDNTLESNFRKTIAFAPDTYTGEGNEYNSIMYSKYFAVGFRDTSDRRGLHIMTKSNNASWTNNSWENSVIMTLNSEGNVGIGTATPRLKLDISSGTNNGIFISNMVETPGYAIQRLPEGLSFGPLPTGFSQINRRLTVTDEGITVTNSISIGEQTVLSPGQLGPSIKTSSLESVGTLNGLDVTGKIKENGGELIPRGVIVAWTGSIAPTGWALCNGTNGTPDLRGRFIIGVGAGPGLSVRNLNSIGGSETHTLTISEMPNHTHLFFANMNAFQAFDTADGNEGFNSGGAATAPTQSAGGSQPHNNMPPFYTLAYIMKL